MAYEGKVISGDGHIDLQWLPGELFTENSPSHLKTRMPVVKETDDGKQWFADGKPLGIWVAGALIGLKGWWEPYVPGVSKRLDKMEERGFSPMARKVFCIPAPPSCGFAIKTSMGLVVR